MKTNKKRRVTKNVDPFFSSSSLRLSKKKKKEKKIAGLFFFCNATKLYYLSTFLRIGRLDFWYFRVVKIYENSYFFPFGFTRESAYEAVKLWKIEKRIKIKKRRKKDNKKNVHYTAVSVWLCDDNLSTSNSGIISSESWTLSA